MLGRAIGILVGAVSLVMVPLGSGFAFADGNNDSDNSLSAFIASPVFAHVAPPMRSTIAAGPIFAPRAGLVCQTMTQTIDIDGQNVHASALLCRQLDGTWRLAPPQDVKTRRSGPASRGSAIAKVE
jgi:surface antigen